MDALVFEGPGRMTFADRPRPQAGPGEVVVRVTASGICGSEMTSFTGESTRRAPGLIFGHEFVGRVLRSAPDAPQDLADQLVAVNPLITCGVCAQCRGGRPNACPNRVLLGLHVDGGFAEEVAVPYSGLRPLGDLDELAGTLIEPLANAVHAVSLLGAVVGRRIAVFGAGPIGLCVISVLRVAGAGSIVALDPVESRRKLALGAGATEALTPIGADLAALGFDDVIDAAGVGAARRAAIDSAPYGATVVLLGMHEAETELQLNAAVTKELRLQCSYCYTPREFDTALEIMRDGSVSHSDWITELKLAEGQQAFETLVNHPESATKIVLRP